MTNLRDRGVVGRASPKAPHCVFKQILDFMLGTGSTRFKDQRSFEYIIVCVMGVPLDGDVWVILGSH